MPRKRFLQALEEAIHCLPGNIQNLCLDDGETLTFTFSETAQNDPLDLCLKLIATNVDEYPASNGYILFTEDYYVDPRILNSLERLQAVIDRKEILEALRIISHELCRIIAAGQAQDSTRLARTTLEDSMTPTLDALTHWNRESKVDYNVDEVDMDWNGSDIDSDNGFGFDDHERVSSTAAPIAKSQISGIGINKIKDDLRAAKDAGFKVGIHGDLIHGGVVCVSIRVSKLGISEEAMRAWALSGRQYLVLLIRFKHGYRDLDQLKEDKPADDRVEMHVSLSNQHKPSLQQISEAFDQAGSDPDQLSQPLGNSQAASLEPLFIDKPLNDLLRDRFASIVKFRSIGISWTGAERLFNETQGSMARDLNQAVLDQQQVKDTCHKGALPEIVMSDQLETTSIANASLPLVAMQFVLRHFVRCTEFCLACHCLTEDTFEALKPYVCSKPLCLYQFMSYGFGPPVEYEILSQPHVVDLLVSLCFGQAAAHRLHDMPLGLNLKVPLLPDFASIATVPIRQLPGQPPGLQKETKLPKIETAFRALWDRESECLIIDSAAWSRKVVLADGDWIALLATDDKTRHFRVKNFLPPRVYLFEGIVCPVRSGDIVDTLPRGQIPVDCYTYNQDFDSLPRSYQQQAILSMLKCIPAVTTLRHRLLQQRGNQREATLHRLRDIPLAARDLLRWIIASNRSCIVQVDTVGNEETDSDSLVASEPRVAGMEDWIQFRFAQGAPDKEQRFVDSVKAYASNVQHPTLFAWHGSPFYNWHSIIRHGLNFDQILHGRASGHGVYMSSDLNTSVRFSNAAVAAGGGDMMWTNSELRINQVVSLQEVVNAPVQFVSNNPHFVVAQKEWIQSRYIFVKSDVHHSKKGSESSIFEQDPSYVVRGAKGEALRIPITAIPRTRRPEQAEHRSHVHKIMKSALKEKKQARASIENDSGSEATDEEDLHWFTDDQTLASAHVKTESDHDSRGSAALQAVTETRKRNRDQPGYILDQSKTNFRPGTLDISNIKILPPPVDASPAATRTLLKAFQTLLQTQESTPLEEIGFYIDPDRMENMYQWIIELHSFDQDLPLTQDMNKAGLTSVVLEMRFTNQFPFSPPFVRVVKPRFLPFLQGGGGHVTEGGAICMELLTNTGWSVVSSIESVILQIKLAMSEKERPARLLTTGGRKGPGKPAYDLSCYGIHDAVQAFKRACSKHGWRVPDGVDAFSSQG